MGRTAYSGVRSGPLRVWAQTRSALEILRENAKSIRPSEGGTEISKRFLPYVLLPLLAVVPLALGSSTAAGAASPSVSFLSIPHAAAFVCRLPGLPDRARCNAQVLADPNTLIPLASSQPPASAYSPSRLRHGYGFDAIGCYPSCGQGQTNPIVD